MEKEKKAKVVCALSGGIDSAVAAGLLKERSEFDTAGVFMQLWEDQYSTGAERRAKNICDILNIPFFVLDFRNDFKKRVVDYFLRGARKGLTPNPCVVCNKEIKFGLLWDIVKKTKADFLATGHYARIVGEGERIKLIRGRDKERDQSYFLWQLSQAQLQNVLFPIGGYTKEEVEEMARKFRLPVVGIPKSQDLCFVRSKTHGFLKKKLSTEPGRIVDPQGGILGRHEGLWFYTIGQRKKIELPGGPFYVLNKDIKKNILVVAREKEKLYSKKTLLEKVNWISGEVPQLPLNLKVKVRYRNNSASALLFKARQKDHYSLEFKKSQFAVTPGQSAVFYKKEEVLGGGIII